MPRCVEREHVIPSSPLKSFTVPQVPRCPADSPVPVQVQHESAQRRVAAVGKGLGRLVGELPVQGSQNPSAATPSRKAEEQKQPADPEGRWRKEKSLGHIKRQISLCYETLLHNMQHLFNILLTGWFLGLREIHGSSGGHHRWTEVILQTVGLHCPEEVTTRERHNSTGESPGSGRSSSCFQYDPNHVSEGHSELGHCSLECVATASQLT